MTKSQNECQDAEIREMVIAYCTTGWTVPYYKSAKDTADLKLLKAKLR